MPASDIPREFDLAECKVTFAKGDDGVRRFEMLAYSGARVHQLFGDMILDLSGIVIGRKRKPILRDHDSGEVAGHSESVSVDGGGVHIAGRMSAVTDAGREIAALADEGFPWEASVGVAIDQFASLKEGESREINGKLQKGPLTIASKFRLREISFVPNGADANTSASVFNDSGAGAAKPREADMPNDKKVDPVAAFETDHGDQVEKWKSEAATAAVKGERERFKALHEAFADRTAFVCGQFLAGNDVEAARAKLSGVLIDELAAKQKQLDAAQTKLAEAEKKSADADGHDGVDFKGDTRDEGRKTKLTVEQQARQDWKDDKDGCTSEFSDVGGYERYLENEARIESNRETALASN